MDLKRVQEELRSDISHHQALMEMLKKTPQDQALILKLKAVQRHIAELGAKQKRIILAPRDTQAQSRHIRPAAMTVNNDARVGNDAPLKPDHNLQTKNSPGVNAGKLTLNAQQSSNAAVNNSTTTYTLITIKNGPQPAFTSANKGTQGSANVPINLSQLAVRPSMNKPFSTQPALLVVSSSNQMPVKPIVSPVLQQNSIPLTSLVSTGGVVALPGWKNNQQPSCSSNVGEAVGRLVPAKPVQIKMPVVQSPGSNPLILMPQKSPVTSQQKSLFRLLPKGRHPIPVNSVQATTVSPSLRKVVPSPQISKSIVPKNSIPTIMMKSDPSRSQPLQQILVPRMGMGNVTTVGAPPTSVTWQDLSSKTPAIHKPSYVPRKTFPNINNGVGSFQKFRILDGKAQILPKSQENTIAGNSGSLAPGLSEKPKHTALKAVLTSSKTPLSAGGTVTLARLVPATVHKNGFFPIQQKQDSACPKPSPAMPSLYSPGSTESPFVPVPVTTASSFRPIIASLSSNSAKISDRSTPVLDEEAKAKMSFLRNIDLIPKEQAEKVRGRRFRKRRVAANPVYSGGMYVSNELEPKRQCPDLMANAIESITAPDVIVKRPRGRPRGSKNFAPALRLQSSTRGTRTSPSLPANVEEIRKLRGILDAVTSKGTSENDSKRSRNDTPDQSRRLSYGAKLPDAVKSVGEAETSKEKLSGENADEHEDQCAKCGKTGEVLMCDTCSRVYHLSCTTPPLTTVPQGMWVCSKCKKEFKESKSKVEWPGIVSVVHSFMEFDKSRDKEIESEQEKLDESKKVIVALQTQIKTLNSVVLAKAAARSKVTKEKQSLLKDIGDFNTLVQNVWNIVARGGGLKTAPTS